MLFVVRRQSYAFFHFSQNFFATFLHFVLTFFHAARLRPACQPAAALLSVSPSSVAHQPPCARHGRSSLCPRPCFSAKPVPRTGPSTPRTGSSSRMCACVRVYICARAGAERTRSGRGARARGLRDDCADFARTSRGLREAVARPSSRHDAALLGLPYPRLRPVPMLASRSRSLGFPLSLARLSRAYARIA